MTQREDRERRAAARQWVQNYKTKHSTCADCKIKYPHYILDFDHVKGKSVGISRALQLGTNLDKIKEEVKKCEIVCANCHRQRTYNRQKS